MVRLPLVVSLLCAALCGCGGPGDAAQPLGARRLPGYHVLAGAATEIPGGDIGYLVTANGQGGYRLVYTDTIGSPAQFLAVITCDGVFDPAQLFHFNPQAPETITISADNRTITVQSVPGADVDGVDFVSSVDPIYVDARVDGGYAGFNIYFTGARTGRLFTSGYDPVSFTSP